MSDLSEAKGFFNKVVAFYGAHPKAALAIEVATIVFSIYAIIKF